jgi:hypothetical protein
VDRKQGARLDGPAVGRVDDAPSCEFGELQVRPLTTRHARFHVGALLAIAAN